MVVGGNGMWVHESLHDRDSAVVDIYIYIYIYKYRCMYAYITGHGVF